MIYSGFIIRGVILSTILRELIWVDLSFIILLLGMIYKGVRSGVSGQIVPLIGTIVLTYISIGYYKSSAEAFFGSMLQNWAKPVSFILICFLVLFVFRIIDKLFNFKSSGEIAMIERLAGIAIAIARTIILCGAVTLFLLLVPIKTVNKTVKEESKVALMFAKLDIDIYCVMSKFVNKNSSCEKDIINREFIGTVPDNITKNSGDKNET